MRKYVPNILSVLRIALTFPVLWLLFQGYREWSLALFVIAMLTDILDGWMARKFNMKTDAGHFLDPLADKFVVFFVFIGFVLLGGISLWGFLIFSRDIGVLSKTIFNMAKYGRKGAAMLEPSIFGKMVTVLQTLSIIVIYLNFTSKYLLILTAILSIVAGIRYLFSTSTPSR